MTIYEIDPLSDSRWHGLVRRHPNASVFHTPGWLEALRRSYGYKPVVYTTSPPTSELSNGVVFCLIDSWLTGRRLVSLPFTDHCEPLTQNSEDLQEILAFLAAAAETENLKYIELRLQSHCPTDALRFERSAMFLLHRLDLRPSPNELLQEFHKDSVQRKIRRAEREGLAYEEGRSEVLLDTFYRLLLLTRRRHKLPPQPLAWFHNLIGALGDRAKIRVASKNGRPVASILTLSHNRTVMYKYGCSDARLHNLGGMAFLFWKTIKEAKEQGLLEFDLGRSDLDNPGLVTFKDRWGAVRSSLTYLRYPPASLEAATKRYAMQLAKRVFAHIPDDFLAATGKLLYRHIG